MEGIKYTQHNQTENITCMKRNLEVADGYDGFLAGTNFDDLFIGLPPIDPFGHNHGLHRNELSFPVNFD